jgi:N-acyl-L-homoserine lactone synthetase
VSVVSEWEVAGSLADFDRTAAVWVDRAAPVTFAPAASARDREAVYRLRYEVVVERGWASPEELPDGMERDRFDEQATHLLARAGDDVVGTSRVVFPVPGRPLPTEAAFDLVVAPAGLVVNLDRMLVRGAGRTADRRIFAGLVGRAWQEARARGFSTCCGIVSVGMLRLFRTLGVEFAVLGAARRHWNEDRFPVRFGLGSPDWTLRLRSRG